MRSRILVGVASGLLISACGGGGGDGPVGGASASRDRSFASAVDGATIRQVGIVSFQPRLTEDNGYDALDVYMQFFRLDDALTPAVLADMDARRSALRTEGCTVERSGDGGEPGAFERIGRTPVSAGEVLVLGTPAGTLAELRTDESGASGLASIQGPIPAGARIDIPGAEFPAFDAAVPVVPQVTDIAITNAPDGRLSGSSVVSWTPSSDADSVVGIGFFGVEAGDDDAANPFGSGGGGTSVRCVTPDDGSFAFPVELRDMLDAGTFDSDVFSIERHEANLATSGDALLIVESTGIGVY